MTRTRETTEKTKPRVGLTSGVVDDTRILIVCDDDPITECLKTVFREAGFSWKTAKNMTEGCESAKSGRFQLVVCPPLLSDGSWRRLIEVADHYDLSFEVVLLARNFDLNEWAQALKDGAFDVLDVISELPKAAEVATGAFRAALLKRSQPLKQAAYSGRVA